MPRRVLTTHIRPHLSRRPNLQPTARLTIGSNSSNNFINDKSTNSNCVNNNTKQPFSNNNISNFRLMRVSQSLQEPIHRLTAPTGKHLLRPQATPLSSITMVTRSRRPAIADKFRTPIKEANWVGIERTASWDSFDRNQFNDEMQISVGGRSKTGSRAHTTTFGSPRRLCQFRLACRLGQRLRPRWNRI